MRGNCALLFVVGFLSLLSRLVPEYGPLALRGNIKGPSASRTEFLRGKFAVRRGDQRLSSRRLVRRTSAQDEYSEWKWGVDDPPIPRHELVPAADVTTCSGREGVGRGWRDGIGTIARFNEPVGIAAGPSGSVYVADSRNSCIRKIAPNGEVTTLAGEGRDLDLSKCVDGPASLAKFFWPQHIDVDSDENIYVADTYAHTIRKIDTTTMEVTTIAGKHDLYAYVDGPPRWSRFKYPYGVGCGPVGDVYVTDVRNHMIRRVDEEGETSTVMGFDEVIHDFDMEKYRKARETGEPEPIVTQLGQGIQVDSRGRVFFVDCGRHTLNVIEPDGQSRVFVGQDNSIGSQDGIGTEAMFYHPFGFDIDKDDNMYIADTDNNLIRKVLPDATVLKMAGDLSESIGKINGGYMDGPSNQAKFNGPRSVAVTPNGDLYVTDLVNHCIRKITIEL
ncbi:hypothetical protein AAMO2058_000467900 [Amorphochlora amoebiformis]